MLPKYHFLLGAIFSIILVEFFQFSLLATLFVFLASFLIDVDHYFYYVFKKKNLNLKKSYIWFIRRERKWRTLTKRQKSEYKHVHLIFHGIEFWTLIFILSFINNIFIWILIGISFHMFLDFTKMIYSKDSLHIKSSQIYVFLRNRTKRKHIID